MPSGSVYNKVSFENLCSNRNQKITIREAVINRKNCLAEVNRASSPTFFFTCFPKSPLLNCGELFGGKEMVVEKKMWEKFSPYLSETFVYRWKQ